MINSVQGLDYEVLHFVGCDDDLGGGGKDLEDGGENGVLDGDPGSGVARVSFHGSAGFMYERQGRDHLGEALVALKEGGNEVGGLVGGHCSNKVDGLGRKIMQRKRRAYLSWPG